MRTLKMLSLAALLTGCAASSEPDADDVSDTTQALTGVRTGNGTTIFCASTIVLYGNGVLESCVLGNNTGVATAAGGTVFFKAATNLIVWPNGTPQRGTLLNNANVRTPSGHFAVFEANTEIVMDTSGNAFSGFLASDTGLPTGSSFAPCAALQRVDMFLPSGFVQTCVMFQQGMFANGSGGIATCAMGHRATLSAAGVLLSCP